MGQTLTELRQEVADALIAEGIDAMAFINPNPEPPIALVGPGTPYIEPEDFQKFQAGKFKVRLEVTLIAALVANDETTEVLDELVVQALTALCVTKDWNLENVGEPGTIQGTSLLAVNITITNRLEVN